MKHFFHNSEESDQVFILLHGTGGRETDLLPAAGQVDSSLSVLGIRGDVEEKGQFRYFKRKPDGSMDEESLKVKTQDLLDFLSNAVKIYQLDKKVLHLIGYSNGANMAVSLILHRPELFRSAMLFHPSHPLQSYNDVWLNRLDIFVTAGAMDQLVLPSEAVQLKKHLSLLGANVSLHLTDHGHELRNSEFAQASKWWNEKIMRSGMI
ncbi:alpha/beta hydrolase [Metabacillus idriensis]|uniref:alpha/beta hydrolase n=1 Tax=Metabacillus idriensis TaxID=324768 RepID=UPI002812EEB9|nr:alpha/beta hydrolase [Metabacillus idriensis]MDR0140165.1 alpha/beta hydrolase [Metabacillus idriensis]